MIREIALLKTPIMTLLIASLLLLGGVSVHAETGTDFAGTVLSVDAAAGKLAVKKEPGGTRFTFVVNDKTQFSGAAVKCLADLKKGDNVTVKYVVSGSQYMAQTITVKDK